MKHFNVFKFIIVAAVAMVSSQVWGEVTPLSLPKTWDAGDGKSAYTNELGCTLSGLGSDYSDAPKLKFDNQGDYMIIQVADAPGSISFNIKGNSVSGTYSFKVQESSDGNSYTDALNITSVSGSSASKTADLKSTTRYIKLIYVTKASGNMGIGGISITKYSSEGEGDGEDSGEDESGTLTINYTKLTNPHTNTTITYNTYNWSATNPDGTISGVYNGASSTANTSLQFNYSSKEADVSKYRDRQAVYNTVAVPGKITSIKMTTASGTERVWKAYVGTAPLTPDNFATNGTIISAADGTKITATGTTFTVPDNNKDNNTYFYLNYTTGSASYISDIVITYETETPTPPTPTEYNINYVLTHVMGDAEINPTTTDAKADVECLFTADDNYTLPSTISVKVGDTELSEENVDYMWDAEDGELTIAKEAITDDVTITITGEEVVPPAPETKRIYMVSGFADWSNAKYAVYDVTHGTWLDHFMTEDVCSGGYYDDIPTDCAIVVFGRFNTAKQSQPAGDWNTGAVDMWNQSVNVVWGENNLFTTKGYGTYGDDNGKAYGDLSTFALPTYTVTLAKNPNNYGSISPTSIDAVPCGTNISASGNKLNVGNTTITATPKDATAQYTYAFDTWSWTDNVTSVESNITATANFSRVVNSYTVGEITLNDCSITSGTWPTGTFEYGYEFDLTIAAPAGYRLNKTLNTSGCSASWTPDLEENATSGTVHVKITGANSSLTIGKTALKYTVTWMANGVQLHQQTNISYNAALTMPSTNPDPCDAFHHFMGWTATQDYTAATAPGDLFLLAGDKKVTANTTYYAVYGQIGEAGEPITVTLNATGLSTGTYKTGTKNDDRGNQWSYYASVNNQSGTLYFGLNADDKNYNIGSPNFAGKITAISLKAYNGSSTDDRKFLLCSSNSVAQPSSGDLAEISIAKSESFSKYYDADLSGAGNFSQFYIYAAKALGVSEVKVTYSNISYSSYSTTCSNPTWTVTFDNQGHGATPSSQQVEHNGNASAPSPAPQATGWAFGGWYKEAACTNAWDFANDKVTGNITLYAKWTCYWRVVVNGVGSYPLSYNSETGKMTAEVNLQGNSTYYFYFTDSEIGGWTFGLSGNATMTKDNDPEHPWEFNQSTQEHLNNIYCGLATTASGNYTFVAAEETGSNYVKIKANVTYPASVAVTFNKQGKGDNEILYTAPNSALVTLPTTPEALSFRFDGWYNDQECTSPWSSTELIAADKTVYAKWTELRTTLYLNAGVWKTESAGEKFAVYYFTNDKQYMGWSEFMTPYECDGAIYITTIPQGYDKVNFVRLNSTCVTPDWADKWNQTSNKALADSWNKCSITKFVDNSDSECSYELYTAPQKHITFDDNGADEGEIMVPIDLDCGSSVTLPTMTRTKAHYTFEGWEDANGTDYADGATIENVTEDIVLIAQWEAIPQYTITFHVPECATTPSAITKYKDEVINLSEIAEPTINNADYTFVGWSRDEQTTANVTCPTIETSITFSENVDLYAIYSIGSEHPTGEFKLSANINGTEYYAQALAAGKKYLGATTSEANGYIFGLEDGEYLYYKNGETRTYVYYPNNSTDIAVVSPKNENNYNKWTLEIVKGNTITLKNKGGNRYLGGSISSSIARFAAYSSESQLTRHDIMEGQTEYTSAPVCTPVLNSITVDATEATKTTYRQHVDNALTTEGIVVTAHFLYTDETEVIELSSCQFSTPDFETAGEQAITVTYSGVQTTYNITVTPTYKVTYVGGEGATSVPSDNTWYDAGNEVTVLGPGLMGKPNSMFQYWVYNETHYTGNEQIIMPASNITFTAQWVAAITVTLHYEGYTTDCDQLMSGAQGSTITLPDGKEVVGKTFEGWSDGKTTYLAGTEYTLTESTTLTATYTNWTITLNYNNISTPMEVPETGVVLPTTVPEGALGAVNNIFIGFTKTQLTEAVTDLPDDFIAAGETYLPTTAGEILYALYRQGDAQYKLIKDTKDLRLGAHVVLASIDEDYAMGNTFISGQDTLPAIVVTKDGDNETILFGKDVQEWVLDASDSKDHVGEWSFKKNGTSVKYLAAPSVGKDKLSLASSKTVTACFTLAIDASGRVTAKSVAATSTTTHNTLSMGENGFFACYRLQDITTPDLAIYQHIGTKYVTSPTAVYRVKSVDLVNGRLDKNDYYAVNDTITLSGYANDGYSTSNRYIVLGESNRQDTISKTRGFRMPAYNVVDTLTNRAKQDTITFMVPECVILKKSEQSQKVDWNTELTLPQLDDINSWNFVGWTKTAINDTSEVHSEIFTTYTIPHVDRDTFYAIYSYDGLPTTGFVLSTVNSETTYYLGEYVSGSDNRYFRAVTDKAQALVLHNNGGKLSYQSGDTVAYLKANAQGTSSVTYNLLTTNEANATVWTIEENGTISIKTTINAQERYLRFNNTNKDRYSIYGSSTSSDPVKEKAPSYTTNPVCDLYIHYFVSDDAETPEFSYKLGDDGKAAQYYPQNECGAKRFIGWSENKVTTLQQEKPTLVDFATQKFDRDVNLYAVYAAENGGKITNEFDRNITESIDGLSYFKTEQDSGMASLNTRYTFHNADKWINQSGVYHIRLTKGSGVDTSYVTTSLIRGLKQIQVTYNTSYKPEVYISSNSTEWTKLNLSKSGSDSYYTATPATPGDYYVAYCIEKSETKGNSDISTLAYTVISPIRYWLSDYSTNCNVAETATITYEESTESSHQATSIGEVITLPTPKMAGKHFEHWTIKGVDYNAGESYKLSHDVTATASWSDPQLVCTPETLYVVSAKGKTVRSSQTINISCPEITEGTLATPVDIEKENGKLHFILENATATEDGLNATLAVEYTPKTATNMAAQEVTLTIGSISTKVKVRGICLPDQFVIAHKGSDEKWYALPADITAYNTYTGYEITVDGGNATAPQNAVYHLGAGQDATSIRLMADTLALMTSATASAKTKIKVGVDTLNTLSYWKIVTDNDNTLALVNTAANNSLKVNTSNKFGMYVTGTSNDSLFHIFKVTTTVATIPIETTNWTENSFSFIPSVAIPENNEFRLRVNDEEVETESCTARNALYDVTTSSTTFGAQKLVQLQWYNNSTLVATASAVTPLRLTSDATLAGIIGCDTLDAKSLDIVVTSGTLTVDAKATIHNLDICAGATVAITNDTLTATTLSFHGGLTSTESNYEYDVPRLYIQKESCTTAPGYLKKNARIYYYLNVNADNYYPFTVPFKTTGANIRYASRPNTEIQSIWGNAIVISKYNGEARGKGQSTDSKYWTDLSYTTDINPGVGYIITAKKLKGEPYAALRIMMMASDIDATTDAVSVGAWGVDDDKIAWYNKGWNYIANPYTAMLAGNNADETHHAIQSGTEVRYATIPSPTVDGYDQIPIADADLKPFYGFFIQAGADGNYNFVKSGLHSAPAYLLAEEKPEQEAYINLDGATMHDQFGLIMGPNYSSDYEFNADLSKELGTANDLRAWLMAGEMKMAYLAVDDETAATLIPLNLRTPAESEYTFSLRESSRVDDLESLFLYDFETGTITNLLNSDYTFSAPAGAVDNRFTLNAVRSAKAPTELGGGTTGDRRQDTGQPPHKRLIDGHIYIIVNGATFNAEGKEVTK